MADDHRVVARALCTLLSANFKIVACVYGGDELLDLLTVSTADCLLLDLNMPGRNGLQLIPLIRRQRPAMKIAVLTMLNDRRIANVALENGADAFVPKDCPPEELRFAVDEALAGRRYLSPRLPKTSHRTSLLAAHPASERLTRRQEQVLLMLGEGLTAKEIAEALGVGKSTITFHKHRIMQEIGIESDGALIRYAVLVREGTANGQSQAEST